MEYKICFVLAIALCFGFACSQRDSHPPYACQCLMETSEREECGFSSESITAEQCTRNGCCFDASVPDVPWCFRPSGERASVTYAKKTIPSQERKECGYEGITRKRCKRIGCCFDVKASGTPTCFHPPVNEGCSVLLEGVTAPSKCQCDVDPHKRDNCGPPGITPQECENKGCCFNSAVPGVPWCFKPKPPKLKCRCDVDPHKRANCGPPGITPQECENKGCCFNSAVPGVPWCFKPKPPKYRKVCPTDVKLRKDCGYPGISASACVKRKCCFNRKPPGVPWCFFHILEEEC
uniref:P-type domain-containing protein n=1 Tax=Naja naja TaxID=35670 RepID=A0A8C6XXZ8_NAJNA